MPDNYAKIVRGNLEKLYRDLQPDLARALPAEQNGERFEFRAFGQKCLIQPDGIFLDDELQNGVIGILISLYVLHAKSDALILEPFQSFKEIPNSMPYTGAFNSHTQQVLIPYIDSIQKNRDRIIKTFRGRSSAGVGGDFAFAVFPLPKIALCYIFYEADDDFPASATCLYSNNAHLFLPTDALADVGEYTSKSIIQKL